MDAAKKGVRKRFGVGKQAPPELLEQPTPNEESQDIIPTRKAFVARPMFAKQVKARAVVAEKPEELAEILERKQAAPVEVDIGAELPLEGEQAEEVSEVPEAPEQKDEQDLFGLKGEFKEMGELILDAETNNLYNTTVPTEYVPQTRRGFSDFIKSTYEPYTLPDTAIQIPEGEKYYPYQKFVRDYMRKESPYRGILVYHGLGSGKTCTSIAASEALFASSKKKIIVMTPRSLKKNFLKEVSFCGFRHFQLKNYWVSLEVSDPTATLFANQIYGLSGKYIKSAKHIWIPDFRKPQSESNFETLPEEDRIEIRKQILSMVEWDPIKNPSGRIRFISYNGITAKKLKAMACDPAQRFFDDSVIIVDEIHNLIRLMQGKIEPYLTKLAAGKKVKRTVPVEVVTPGRWKPTLCPQETKNYTRGYLFYRLLLDAQNSKIIGLSGTPLINFPEEIGILANVLHGYISVVEGVIPESGKEVQQKAEALGHSHPYVDFVSAKQDSKGGGTHVLMSLLPRGVRKIENDVGVVRIPEEDDAPGNEEVVESIRAAFEAAKIPLGRLENTAKELLPPFGESFRDAFVTGQSIKQKAVLVTRLTGLVSYYKGANLELMPRVKVDEIVRVPFSNYAQKAYSFKRSTEVKSEMEKTPGKTLDAVWSQVYELGDSADANNYKMGSRQACNFAFPPSITRPTPNPKDKKDEAAQGVAVAGIVDLSPEEDELGDEVEMTEEVEDIGAVAAEDAAIEQDIYEGAEGEEALVEAEIKAATQAEALRPNTTRKAGPVTDDVRFSQSLKNEYRMFDNSAATPITITTSGETDTFPTVEHYYQAVKFQQTDPEWFKQIRDAPTAIKAREMGGSKDHKANPAFKEVRIQIMRRALEVKFADPKLAELLLSTGDKKIVNASAKNSYWGEGAEKLGENHLGKLLMELRGELRSRGDMPVLEGGGKTPAELRLAAECKAGTKPGEKYPDACRRAKECLKTIARANMILGGPDGLATYSPKYAAILQRVAAAPGSSLVYSEFLDMEGIGIFRIAMDVNGYAPIEITSVGGALAFTKATEESIRRKQPRYITFSGQEDQEIRRTALDLFNAKFSELPESMRKILAEVGYKDNKLGEICRVFCITAAGAEGLSLRNVRAVHIMQPYWNEVRLRQVKGRAIRIGSHLDLPEDQRDVSIYTYISCFSDMAQDARTGEEKIDETILLHDSVDAKAAAEYGLPIRPGMTNYVLTTDEMLFAISERKRKIIEGLECIMKSAAVDCELNYKQNKDGTFRCLPLKGKVGDFIYNPILEKDLIESSKFEDDTVCSGEVKPQEIYKAINKVSYMLREVFGPDKTVVGYDVFEATESVDPKNPARKVAKKKVPEVKVGTVGVKIVNGVPQPGPPVKITPAVK
jgi:ribA/ribD-fused uncharacterized protein